MLPETLVCFFLNPPLVPRRGGRQHYGGVLVRRVRVHDNAKERADAAREVARGGGRLHDPGPRPRPDLPRVRRRV